MNLTEQQKESVENRIENFEEKFIKIKNEFFNMGYKEKDIEELAWASFIVMNAGITPEEYDYCYKEIYDK